MDSAPKQNAQETKPEHGKGHGYAWYLLAIAAIPTLYVLSLAPLTAHYSLKGQFPDTFDAYYAPLDWALDHCPPLNAAFDWYRDDVCHYVALHLQNPPADSTAITNSPSAGPYPPFRRKWEHAPFRVPKHIGGQDGAINQRKRLQAVDLKIVVIRGIENDPPRAFVSAKQLREEQDVVIPQTSLGRGYLAKRQRQECKSLLAQEPTHKLIGVMCFSVPRRDPLGQSPC